MSKHPIAPESKTSDPKRLCLPEQNTTANEPLSEFDLKLQRISAKHKLTKEMWNECKKQKKLKNIAVKNRECKFGYCDSSLPKTLTYTLSTNYYFRASFKVLRSLALSFKQDAANEFLDSLQEAVDEAHVSVGKDYEKLHRQRALEIFPDAWIIEIVCGEYFSFDLDCRAEPYDFLPIILQRVQKCHPKTIFLNYSSRRLEEQLHAVGLEISIKEANYLLFAEDCGIYVITEWCEDNGAQHDHMTYLEGDYVGKTLCITEKHKCPKNTMPEEKRQPQTWWSQCDIKVKSVSE